MSSSTTATRDEHEPGLTLFPAEWTASACQQQEESGSGLAAIPKLLKSFFSGAGTGSSESGTAGHASHQGSLSIRGTINSGAASSSRSSSKHRQQDGQRRTSATSQQQDAVPFPTTGDESDSEGENSVENIPHRPVRPTRLSVMGRTGPQVGLSASHATSIRNDLSASVGSHAANDRSYGDTDSVAPDELHDNLGFYRSEAPHRQHLNSVPGFPLPKALLDDSQSVISAGGGSARRLVPPLPRTSRHSDAMKNITSVIREMRGEGINQTYWMPDESTKQCCDCQSTFSAFRRKHHCRICGQIFCAWCANHIVDGTRYGKDSYLRVCNFCFSVMDQYDHLERSEAAKNSAPKAITPGLSASQQAHQPATPTSRFLGSLALDDDRLSLTSRRAKKPRPQISAPLEANIRPPQSQFAASAMFPRTDFPASALIEQEVDGGSPPLHRGASGEFHPYTPRAETPNDFFQPASPKFFDDSPGQQPYGDPALASSGQYAPFRKQHAAGHHQDPEGMPVHLERSPPPNTPDPSTEPPHPAAASSSSKTPNQEDQHHAEPKVPFPTMAIDEQSKLEPLPPAINPSNSFMHQDHAATQGLAIDLGPPSEAAIQGSTEGPSAAEPGYDFAAAAQATTPEQHRFLSRMTPLPTADTRRLDSPALSEGPSSLTRPQYFYRTRSRVSSLGTGTDPSDELFESTRLSGTPGRIRKESLSMVDNELTSMNFRFVQALLGQVLNKSGLDSAIWEGPLLRLLLRATKTIRTNPRVDDMDTREYIKIKRLPGGKPSDSEYIDGIIFTQKLLRKQMFRKKKNPRILLLSYPIDYHRQDQLMSLEAILAQEKEYLANLVHRIVALRPHIILVDQSVSALALDALKDCGITVARDVKPSVMQALSRALQTDIISSLNQQTLRPRLGRCELFQVKTYEHALIPGRRKTFWRFEGCFKDTTGSIVLRGGDMDTLGRVKNVLHYMLSVALHLRSEAFLFHDEHVVIPSNLPFVYQLPPEPKFSDHSPFTDSSEKQAERILTESINVELEPYLNTILSNSPFTIFTPPYPLLKMKLDDTHLRHLRHLYNEEEASHILEEELQCRKHSSGSSTNGESAVTPTADHPVSLFSDPGNLLSRSGSINSMDNVSSGMPTSSNTPFGEMYSTAALNSPWPQLLRGSDLSARLERAEDQHASRLRRFEQFRATAKPIVDPRAHQEIILLQSIFHSASLKPCKLPELVRIEFYGENDTTLGAFLENYVNEVSTPCEAPRCGQTSLVHYKVYVHGQRRVTCVLEQFPCPMPGGQERIYMWSYCKVCQTAAKHTVMNEQTWSYSWAKYLEQSFNGGDLSCKTIYPLCTHNVHKDHVRYFALRNLAVRIYSDPIEVLEVCPPPSTLKVHEDVQARLRAEEVRSMASRFASFWNSLAERLHSLSRNASPLENQEEAQRTLEDYRRRSDYEKQQMMRMLLETHKEYTRSSGLALTSVRRAMQEKVVDWDAELACFEQKFLPSERDLRRLTGGQFKRFFDSSSAPSTPDPRLSSPTLAVEESERDSGDDSVQPSSLLSISDLPGGMPLSAAHLAAVDMQLGDLPNSSGAPGASMPRSLSAPSLPPIQGNPSPAPGSSSTSHTPTATKESTQQEESNGSDSDSTVCADGGEASNREQLEDSDAVTPHLDPAAKQGDPQESLNAASGDQPQQPTGAQQAQPKQPESTEESTHVAQLVKKFNVSPAPSQVAQMPSLPCDSDTQATQAPGVKRPSFKRGHSEYVKRLAHHADSAQGNSGALTDPERAAPQLSDSAGGTNDNPTPRSSLQRVRKQRNPAVTRIPARPVKPVYPPTLKSEDDESERRKVSSRKQTAAPRKVSRSAAQSPSRSAFADASSPRRSLKPPPASHGRPSGGAQSQRTLGQRRVATANSGNRVSALANHFDRLSHEAERERQKRMAALRGKRARPVGVSKAVIEVYASAREALKEDSDAEDEDAEDEDEEGTGADDEFDEDDFVSSSKDVRPAEQKKAAVPDVSTAQPQVSQKPTTETSRGLSEEQSSSVQEMQNAPHSPRPPQTSDSEVPQVQSESELSSSGTEKGSLLKAITSFWGFRGSDFVPLAYPLKPIEHLVADNPVLVREDEPSSLIAYALASMDYSERMKKYEAEPKLSQQSETFMPAETGSLSGHSQEDASNTSNWGFVDLPEDGAETKANKKLPTEHFGLQFDAGGYHFSCKVFFAPEFEELRSQCVDSRAFIESLARCVKWNASGGKSGSAFLKTQDDRYIVKEVSRLELEAFLHFAMEYFSHISDSFAKGVPTLMAKILGLFRISFVTGGKSQRMDFLVMENLFYDRNVSRIYDLKGSRHNRYVVNTGKQGEVLLDENLTEVAYKSPLFVRELAKRDLRMALYNDTVWFSKHNIMDYSLVVGVDQDRQELVVGIVDFIRTYTWDKKLESWVKGTRNEPTIITPKLYKNRLRVACEEYFLLAPDHWTTDAAFLSGHDEVEVARDIWQQWAGIEHSVHEEDDE